MKQVYIASSAAAVIYATTHVSQPIIESLVFLCNISVLHHLRASNTTGLKLAVFGHAKGLASRQPVVNGCTVSYSWPNPFCVLLLLYISHYGPLISSLDFNCHFEGQLHCPTSVPTCEHLCSSTCATGQIFYFLWWESLKAAKGSLKVIN